MSNKLVYSLDKLPIEEIEENSYFLGYDYGVSSFDRAIKVSYSHIYERIVGGDPTKGTYSPTFKDIIFYINVYCNDLVSDSIISDKFVNVQKVFLYPNEQSVSSISFERVSGSIDFNSVEFDNEVGYNPNQSLVIGINDNATTLDPSYEYFVKLTSINSFPDDRLWKPNRDYFFLDGIEGVRSQYFFSVKLMNLKSTFLNSSSEEYKYVDLSFSITDSTGEVQYDVVYERIVKTNLEPEYEMNVTIEFVSYLLPSVSDLLSDSYRLRLDFTGASAPFLAGSIVTVDKMEVSILKLT